MQKKSGVSELVVINCYHNCCHNNTLNTLFIDSTWCPKSYLIHNFSFILFRNIHRQFLMLKFAYYVFTFQKTVGNHLQVTIITLTRGYVIFLFSRPSFALALNSQLNIKSHEFWWSIAHNILRKRFFPSSQNTSILHMEDRTDFNLRHLESTDGGCGEHVAFHHWISS